MKPLKKEFNGPCSAYSAVKFFMAAVSKIKHMTKCVRNPVVQKWNPTRSSQHLGWPPRPIAVVFALRHIFLIPAFPQLHSKRGCNLQR